METFKVRVRYTTDSGTKSEWVRVNAEDEFEAGDEAMETISYSHEDLEDIEVIDCIRVR